jgi:hypothetical protein
MTSAWFAHFADHAAVAADFVKRSDPSMARRFSDAATAARRVSITLARGEQIAQMGVELAEIKSALGVTIEVG